MKDCIVIIGPTASGKTNLAINIALKFGGEIISADSRQIYIGMDIGTGKPTLRQQKKVPHHLLSIITPDKHYSAKEFSSSARKIIIEIKQRGKIPIIVGGTGLYIKALWDGIFKHPPIPKNVRAKLMQELEEKGIEYLYKRLKGLDKIATKRIKTTDTQRIIRALEVYEFTGKPISTLQKESKPSPFHPFYIGIYVPREILKKRIEKRVRKMFEMGFTEEVKGLLNKGYNINSPGFSSIGYREIYEVINGNLSIEEGMRKTITGTLQYAKRQMTWFRKIPNVHWILSQKLGSVV